MTRLWKHRCPKGHVIQSVGKEAYKCNSCDATYHGSPYKAGQHDFPIDEDPREKLTQDEVLENLKENCSPEGFGTKARELKGETTQQTVKKLLKLEQRELVTRTIKTQDVYRWKPTEEGFKK